MYPVSDLFKLLVKERDSVLIVKADVAGEEYDRKDIIDFAIESKLVTGEEFEIGTVIISQLVIKLKLKSEIPKNARIIPYVAYDTRSIAWSTAAIPWEETEIPWEGGTSEWMPLGEFYIDSRTQDDDVWRIVCLDKLIWSETEYKSTLTYPASMQAVWDDMCAQIGYTCDSSVQINPSYMVNVKPIGYTCRQIMGWIAGANSASVKAGKDGKIQFKRYVSNPVSDFKLTTSDYIRAKKMDDLKTYTRFVVTYDDEQDLSYEAGEGSEANTLYYYNPFMTQDMVDGLHATLGGYSYQPVEMDVRGYPHFDAGDEMTFDINESVPWDYTLSSWENTHIPWYGLVEHRSVILNLKLRYAGGFGMALDAPSKSDQQSEFVVVGPVNQKVNQLNKTAVKLGRNYYGVSTTREEGFVVEREDGSARAVFNADELSFWADGEQALWFDIPSRKFHFSGTLVGVDGEFSGTVSAAIIIGSEVQGGTIEGTVIRGSEIYGAYIATSEDQGPRAEMSSTDKMFRVIQSQSNYAEFRANYNSGGSSNIPALRFANGTDYMDIGGIGPGGVFGLLGYNDIYLLAYGRIFQFLTYFPNWSYIRNQDNGKSLEQELSEIRNSISSLTALVYALIDS